jgi:hypothetical protein
VVRYVESNSSKSCTIASTGWLTNSAPTASGGAVIPKFGVEKAKVNWGAFIRNMGVGKATTDRRYDPTSGPGPSVAAHNEDGEKQVFK